MKRTTGSGHLENAFVFLHSNRPYLLWRHNPRWRRRHKMQTASNTSIYIYMSLSIGHFDSICFRVVHVFHYNDVIMGPIASQITSLTIVYSTVYSDADQRKHQSSASLAFVSPVNSPHKWPIKRKMFPFDDVIMILKHYVLQTTYWNTIPRMKIIVFYSNFISPRSVRTGVIENMLVFSSGNSFAPSRRQAITWTNDDPLTQIKPKRKTHSRLSQSENLMIQSFNLL